MLHKILSVLHCPQNEKCCTDYDITSSTVVPALKTHIFFFVFRASLTRRNIFKIPETVTRLSRGQRIHNLRQTTRHCSRNTSMSRKSRKRYHHIAAGGWKFHFFGGESRPPLDLPNCTTAVLRKEWCCWTTSSYDSGVQLWLLVTLLYSMLSFLCATNIVLSCPFIASHVEILSDM